MAEPAIKFDTAAALDRLVEAGVPQKQAAAHVRLLAATINENFATKADIEHLELKLQGTITEVRTEIAEVRTEIAEVRIEIASLETRMTEKIDELRNQLSDRAFDTIKWTAGMQIGTILAIIAAIKLL